MATFLQIFIEIDLRRAKAYLALYLSNRMLKKHSLIPSKKTLSKVIK
jgi:hypothetical protein